MKAIIFVGAGVWSVVYSIFIGLVLSAKYHPTYNAGVDAGIISSLNLMGQMFIAASFHVALQFALERTREVTLTRGEKAWDMATTFLPVVVLGVVTWWMSGMNPKVAWWPTLYWWTWSIVCASVIVDLYNAWKSVKIWRGTVPAAAPADAAHGGGAPAAH